MNSGWKRIFDLVFAVVFLVLLSPLMLLSAIAIKLDDGGPVLFKQKRLTYHGKEFYVYKFRSMVVNAEKAGPQLAKENDSRITRVGRILRKCRLDELPQLINILRGDMFWWAPVRSVRNWRRNTRKPCRNSSSGFR
ncbi:MAG: sugar transferase [Ruminococcus callidus]